MKKLVFRVQDEKAARKTWDIEDNGNKIGEAKKTGGLWAISDLEGNRKTGMLTWSCKAIFDAADLQEIVDQDGQSLGL